ncbi:MAG: glycosyltransferase family 2 protein [Planctomycetaceae bacterium]|nr:glycosyltransferase family 2 protein [Planctomycetaceae bacterium]
MAEKPKPFFSVIIPVYNREQTIIKTLESIAAQEFRDFEVIVVDDGSDDNTCQVVADYKFAHLIRQQNSGPGTARNRGLQEASAQYIAFLDSDDVWFPWTLQQYAKAIAKFNNPAFLTGSPLCFSNEEELRYAKDGEAEYRTFDDYYATGEEWLWHGVSSFVIRRDILTEAGGFVDGRVNGEDAELAMRLGTAKGFVHIASPAMLGYRVHSGNVTLDTNKSCQGLELLIEGERNGKFPGGKKRTRDRAVIISRHVRPFAVECARQGNIVKAFRFYFAIMPEAIRSFRYRFILGLPAVALCGSIRQMMLKLFRVKE